jgi:hypothetical protein
VRGKWAAGIEPRNFTWVFAGHLAVSERPGGSTLVHRRVRRDEELLWLKRKGFTRIISILPATHNLAAYHDQGIGVGHYAIHHGPGQRDVLQACYVDLESSLNGEDVVLLHGDEVSDRLLGLVAGFLVWTGRVPSPTRALALTEQRFKTSIGSDGRLIVMDLPPRVS